MTVSRADAPTFICDLLERAAIEREDLSARRVARELGQTTGFLYHHWGSFDAFLLEVSGVGWRRLVAAVVRAFERSRSVEELLEAYLDFALSTPVLYWLMAERPLPAKLLEERLGAGQPLPSHAAFAELTTLLAGSMPDVTLTQVRMVHAAVHGLASQLLSGRLASTPDTFGRPARAVAREIAVEIARLVASRRGG